MDRAKDVVELLKNEYGIESLWQLQRAISELACIEISPFCAEIKKGKGREDHGCVRQKREMLQF